MKIASGFLPIENQKRPAPRRDAPWLLAIRRRPDVARPSTALCPRGEPGNGPQAPRWPAPGRSLPSGPAKAAHGPRTGHAQVHRTLLPRGQCYPPRPSGPPVARVGRRRGDPGRWLVFTPSACYSGRATGRPAKAARHAHAADQAATHARRQYHTGAHRGHIRHRCRGGQRPVRDDRGGRNRPRRGDHPAEFLEAVQRATFAYDAARRRPDFRAPRPRPDRRRLSARRRPTPSKLRRWRRADWPTNTTPRRIAVRSQAERSGKRK